MHKEKLKDVTEITMGTSPSGDTYNEDENGLPLLNGPTEFGQMSPNCTLFTTDSKRECKSGDLIFCVRGSTTGKMNWADQVYSLGRGVCSIRGNSKLETKYIKYALDYSLRSLLKLAGGGTFPNLTKTTIHNFEIPYSDSRFKIASILSAFDDLIENNSRRIEILEEMARRIYREWFVHYRYPGYEEDELVDSGTDLGEIPEGWEVKEVEDIVNRLSKGNIYRKKNTDDEGNIIIIDQSTDEYLGFHDNEPDFPASPDEPYIIFGDHTCKMQLLIRPFSLGPNVVPFIAEDEELSNYYLYYLLEPIIESREYKRHWTTFKVKKVAGAPTEIADRFEKKVRPLLEQKENLKKQINKLKETRDLLLPKLISGKIDVKELNIDERKTSESVL